MTVHDSAVDAERAQVSAGKLHLQQQQQLHKDPQLHMQGGPQIPAGLGRKCAHAASSGQEPARSLTCSACSWPSARGAGWPRWL